MYRRSLATRKQLTRRARRNAFALLGVTEEELALLKERHPEHMGTWLAVETKINAHVEYSVNVALMCQGE